MSDRNVSDSIEPNELEVKKVKRTPKLSTVRISLGLSIVLLVLVSALTYFAIGPIMQYRETDPVLDGYVQPRSISKLVSLVQDSTVSIYCEYNSEGDYDQGTGWAMNIETDMQDTYRTALITNHHVIENCIGNK